MANSLQAIGFWSANDGGDGGIRPEDWVDAAWEDDERRRVSAYLKQGLHIAASYGYSWCRFRCGCAGAEMGDSDLSDGQFVWPQGFAHYLDFHHVKPPESFLAQIRAKLPAYVEPDDEVRAAARERFARQREYELANERLRAASAVPIDIVSCAAAGDRAGLESELDRGVSPSFVNDDGEFPLYAAAKAGHADLVALLLERGAELDARDRWGRSALGIAAAWRRRDVFELLMAKRAELEGPPTAPMSIVMSAVADADLVERLIAAGADPHRVAPDGMTALMHAADRGAVDGCRVLLDHGVDIDARQSSGMTALFHACKHGEEAVVELLLARGARVDVVLADEAYPFAAGMTPLDAAFEENPQLVDALRAAGARFGTLSSAARYGDADRVAALIRAGADVNGESIRSGVALLDAVAQPRIATMLLDAGADPHRANGRGWCALIAAAAEGELEVVRELLARGADVRQATTEGETALHVACRRSDGDPFVELLLAHGSAIDARSQLGTPLEAAARSGNVSIVELLLRSGAPCSDAPRTVALAHQERRRIELSWARFGRDIHGAPLDEES